MLWMRRLWQWYSLFAWKNWSVLVNVNSSTNCTWSAQIIPVKPYVIIYEKWKVEVELKRQVLAPNKEDRYGNVKGMNCRLKAIFWLVTWEESLSEAF